MRIDIRPNVAALIAAGYHDRRGFTVDEYRRSWPTSVERPDEHTACFQDGLGFDDVLLVDNWIPRVEHRDTVTIGIGPTAIQLFSCAVICGHVVVDVWFKDLIGFRPVGGEPKLPRRYVAFTRLTKAKEPITVAQATAWAQSVATRGIPLTGLVLSEAWHLPAQHGPLLLEQGVDITGERFETNKVPYIQRWARPRDGLPTQFGNDPRIYGYSETLWSPRAGSGFRATQVIAVE